MFSNPRQGKSWTYTQVKQPDNPSENDTWFNPISNTVLVFNGQVWKKWFDDIIGTTGYIAGGYGATLLNIVETIIFPFDSGSPIVGGNLATPVYIAMGLNSSQYGFILGGSNGSSTYYSTIQRFQFQANLSTVVKGNLTTVSSTTTGFNSSNHGYVVGGVTANGPVITSLINRITFPFETGDAVTIGSLTTSLMGSYGLNSTLYGYSCGGRTTQINYISTIYRCVFPNDSGIFSSVGTIFTPLAHGCSLNSSQHGFSLSGIDGVGSYISYISRLQFPFDSGSMSNVGNTNNATYLATGLNSTQHGFYICGLTSYLAIERIAFPFDSGVSTVVGNMSLSKYGAAGIDSTDFVSQFI